MTEENGRSLSPTLIAEPWERNPNSNGWTSRARLFVTSKYRGLSFDRTSASIPWVADAVQHITIELSDCYDLRQYHIAIMSAHLI